MTALFVLCLYPVLQILRVNTRNTLPLWAAIAPLVIFVLAVVLINYSMLLESVGRDPTLTGRTQLWAAVSDAIMRRPWLGYGYASFWRYQGVDLAAVISTIHWAAPHSHDAYLDLCLDLGLTGLVVFLIGATATISRAVKFFQEGDRPSARWPLVFLLYFFMYNLTESELLRSHSTLWLFYVSVYVSLAVRRYQQPDEAFEIGLEPELA
jgi:O-antigen ligase